MKRKTKLIVGGSLAVVLTAVVGLGAFLTMSGAGSNHDVALASPAPTESFQQEDENDQVVGPWNPQSPTAAQIEARGLVGPQQGCAAGEWEDYATNSMVALWSYNPSDLSYEDFVTYLSGFWGFSNEYTQFVDSLVDVKRWQQMQNLNAVSWATVVEVNKVDGEHSSWSTFDTGTTHLVTATIELHSGLVGSDGSVTNDTVDRVKQSVVVEYFEVGQSVSCSVQEWLPDVAV